MAIRSFTDLNAWSEGHKLVISIYKYTGKFPKTENYGLIDQIRRASVSVTSNIAEGFSKQTIKDKKRFYYISLGSLTELQNQLLVARDVGYIDSNSFKALAEQSVVVSKLVNGLIKSATTHTKYKILNTKLSTPPNLLLITKTSYSD